MNLFAASFVGLFMEGGPVMMSLILICFLLTLCFFILGVVFLTKNRIKVKKMIELIGHVSLLALVLGFFGSMLGLVSAFDAIENIKSLSPEVLGAGLKVSFLTALFGSFVFIFARVEILILAALKRDEVEVV